ncbi:MAG: hypothetical protein ACREJM_12690, partial [Candidatus Saccharimonadales bacterium]
NNSRGTLSELSIRTAMAAPANEFFVTSPSSSLLPRDAEQQSPHLPDRPVTSDLQSSPCPERRRFGWRRL